LTVENKGSCISSIPRIASAAKDHEHDIHNACRPNPVYTGTKFNSLLGLAPVFFVLAWLRCLPNVLQQALLVPRTTG
jgi:hypothetical protein